MPTRRPRSKVTVGLLWAKNCYHVKILIAAEVIRRLVTDNLEKTRIEIWPQAIFVAFWRLNGDFGSD